MLAGGVCHSVSLMLNHSVQAFWNQLFIPLGSSGLYRIRASMLCLVRCQTWSKLRSESVRAESANEIVYIQTWRSRIVFL